MFEIILISHGPLSKAMLETAQMIVGEQEHVTCFGLYLGDSVDLFRERERRARIDGYAVRQPLQCYRGGHGIL